MLAYDREIKRRLRGVVRELGLRYLSGRLVDIGCGYRPYERDLRGVVTEHVGVDFAETIYGLPSGGHRRDRVFHPGCGRDLRLRSGDGSPRASRGPGRGRSEWLTYRPSWGMPSGHRTVHLGNP